MHLGITYGVIFGLREPDLWPMARVLVPVVPVTKGQCLCIFFSHEVPK